MLKLLIDTATQALIIGLLDGDQVIAQHFDSANRNHSERLIVQLDRLLKGVGKTIQDVDALIVGAGPGSYTGVRIGVTVGKVLAYTLNKPLFQTSTLALIASSYRGKANYILPIIDARRESVFATIYHAKGEAFEPLIEEKRYPLADLFERIRSLGLDEVLIVGLDTPLYRTWFDSNGLNYDLNFEQSIDFYQLFHHPLIQRIEDIHAFVPNYRRMPEAEYQLKEKQHERKNSTR